MALQTGPGPRGATRWDPDQYLKFADHRLRPALELLGRVPLADPRVIYDLGCGAGAWLLELLEARLDLTAVGVDTSLHPEREARAGESQNLLTWGFQAWDAIRLFEAGKAIATVPVWKGKAAEARALADTVTEMTLAKQKQTLLDSLAQAGAK